MKKKRKLIIQIIPDNTGRTKSLSISYFALKLLFFLSAVVVIIILAFIIKFSEINMKALSAEKLAKKNDILQKKQLALDSLMVSVDNIYKKAKLIENITQVFLLPDSFPKLEKIQAADKLVVSAEQLTRYVTAVDSIQSIHSGKSEIPEQYKPFIWPVKGIITRKFQPGHTGIDIIGRLQSIIVSTAEGMVVESGWRSDLGNVVKINHGGFYTTIYAHLHKNFVQVGDHVNRGKPIGSLGSTGNSTGPHLHYEIFNRTIPVDPENFIRK